MCPKTGFCGEIRLFVAKFGHFCGENPEIGGLFGRFFPNFVTEKGLIFE